jgi:hypothetical protein
MGERVQKVMSLTNLKVAVRMLLVVSVVAAGALLPASPAEEAGTVTLQRTPDRGIQPQVVADGKVVHMIYFRGAPEHGDVFYVRSEDGGARFSVPIRVNSEPGSAIAIGNIRGAQLAVGKGGRVHVAGNSSGEQGRASEGMFYTRLNDAGTAFEPQRNVIHAAVGLDGGGSVAADGAGDVYVAWHAPQPGKKGEDNRRVWVAHSTDEGKTFAAEKPAYDKDTGACGCCGLRAFADRKGTVYLLYRSAKDQENRDTYLLTSGDKGATFAGDDVDPWKVTTCPMSSYAFAEGGAGVLAAWETRGQVYYATVDPATGKRSAPGAAPGGAGNRKHPVVAADAQGRTLLAWTEGMGWNRGGGVAWQVFDKDGKPTAERGRTDGVPTWSLVAAFARPDGGFTIVY